MKINDKAKDFMLPNQNGEEIKLSSLKGKWIVLYFYPKDNTPGCTLEALDFSRLRQDFENDDAVIFGLSKDTIKSHKKFETKKNLEITLLSNPELNVLRDYKAWGLKKLFGKEYEGTVRSTYLIAPDFTIAYIWEKVRAKGHAEKVLEKLRELKK